MKTNTDVQLALPLSIKEEKKDLMTPEQRQKFEEFCLSLRAERDAIFAFVLQQWPEKGYKKPSAVENQHWQEARSKVLGLSDLDCPETIRNPGQTQKQVYKPYRAWSLERKQAQRVKRLRQKALKYSSFPDLWIPWLLEKVLAQPRRYGVCPLPGSCLSCPVNYTADVRQQQAIDRENLRRQTAAAPHCTHRVEVGRNADNG